MKIKPIQHHNKCHGFQSSSSSGSTERDCTFPYISISARQREQKIVCGEPPTREMEKFSRSVKVSLAPVREGGENEQNENKRRDVNSATSLCFDNYTTI
jgi:hypothetical protein